MIFLELICKVNMDARGFEHYNNQNNVFPTHGVQPYNLFPPAFFFFFFLKRSIKSNCCQKQHFWIPVVIMIFKMYTLTYVRHSNLEFGTK